MSTIKPPVTLANADNEHRVDYIQNVASQPDYEITQVSVHPGIVCGLVYSWLSSVQYSVLW